eukprot:490127-Rhodomonas_salina.1
MRMKLLWTRRRAQADAHMCLNLNLLISAAALAKTELSARARLQFSLLLPAIGSLLPTRLRGERRKEAAEGSAAAGEHASLSDSQNCMARHTRMCRCQSERTTQRRMFR